MSKKGDFLEKNCFALEQNLERKKNLEKSYFFEKKKFKKRTIFGKKMFRSRAKSRAKKTLTTIFTIYVKGQVRLEKVRPIKNIYSK